jgi:hypothetical protein
MTTTKALTASKSTALAKATSDQPAIPSQRTARSMKGIYLVASAIYANGLDTQLDQFINANRAGKTPKGAGYRYATGKSIVSESIELDGRKFNRPADPAFRKAIVTAYGQDPVINAMLAEAEARLKATGEVPASVFKR